MALETWASVGKPAAVAAAAPAPAPELSASAVECFPVSAPARCVPSTESTATKPCNCAFQSMFPRRPECRCTTGDQPPETASVSTSIRCTLSASILSLNVATLIALSSLSSPAWVSITAEPISTSTPLYAACCAPADTLERASMTATTPPVYCNSLTNGYTESLAVNTAMRWPTRTARSEEHTSELQSRFDLVC